MYRARKFNHPIKKILSLSATDSRIPLSISPYVTLTELHSEENLVASLHEADLIFIDARLDWADPICLISTIHKWKDAPLVLVCPPGDAQVIKDGYAAGIADILYAPIEKTDLLQILDLFLGLKQRPAFETLL